MILGVTPRVLLCDRRYNPRGVTFREYMNDPDIMRRVQCEFALFRRHFLPCDQEMGLPEQWSVYVDTQNVGEAAWLGAEIEYPAWEVPDTRPFLGEDNKSQLFNRGLPDPFDGIYGRMREWNERLAGPGGTFMGRPVVVEPGGLSTDGLMTIACNLRGAAQFCMNLYLDSDYAMQLLDYITAATILRIRALRDFFGLPVPDNYWFADDSIALLSAADYERLILPFHQKLLAGITNGKGRENIIHLCGDATRHFPLNGNGRQKFSAGRFCGCFTNVFGKGSMKKNWDDGEAKRHAISQGPVCSALLFRRADGGMHAADGSLSAAGCAWGLSLCRVGTVVDRVEKRRCMGVACSGRSTGGMLDCRMCRAMEKQPAAHSGSGICLWQRLALRRGAVVCFSSTEWNNGLCFGRTGGFVPAQRRYIFAVFAAGGMWGRTALKTPADRLCQRKIGG